MKKIYIAIVIVFLILSCNGSKTQQGFTIQVLSDKETIHLNDTLQFDISKNNFGSGVKSVIYRINDKELPKIGVKHVLQNVKLGKQKVIAAITTDDGNQYQAEKELTILAENPPKIYSYRIIAEYPHSTSSYTQGLEFIGDTLIESTGQYGSSTLQKWNVFTGEVYKKIDLNKAYFGEGVTVLNGKIYQLTWQKKIGFVYDMNLNKIQNFNYDQSKEGWGLCNDGKVIYKSDGTEKIWLLNPETLAEENYIQLATNTALYSRANELEWANGKIYANTYLKDGIMIINPENGAIEGVVDVRGLKDKVEQISTLDVLNGIAYHSERKTFFITGKNWSLVFEVVFEEKE